MPTRHHRPIDVLASRVLLQPIEFERTRRFYRDILGLAVSREFGAATHRGVVLFGLAVRLLLQAGEAAHNFGPDPQAILG